VDTGLRRYDGTVGAERRNSFTKISRGVAIATGAVGKPGGSLRFDAAVFPLGMMTSGRHLP
jgi:hypothetical protein